MHRGALAVALAVASLVAACGDDSDEDEPAATAAPAASVDTATIEQQIERRLSGTTTQITEVSCPADVPAKKGATFDCKTKIEGDGTATVVVTQVDGKSSYTYAYKPGTLKVPGSSVEPVVQKDLEADGVDVTAVNCPDTIVVKADSPVTCTAATASGAQIDVTFAFTAEGEVDPASVESG